MKKALLLAIACIAVIMVSVSLVIVSRLNRSQGHFTPWEPLSKPKPDTLKATPGDTLPDPVDISLGTIDRQFVYFKAKHLPSGDGDLQNSNRVSVWKGSEYNKGDTATISMPWGHATCVVIDTIQYRYIDYYNYHEYFYVAQRIDTLEYSYYDDKSNVCMIQKGKCSFAEKYRLKLLPSYSVEERKIIFKWIEKQKAQLVDSFNLLSRRTATKETLSSFESIPFTVDIIVLSEIEKDKPFFLNITWYNNDYSLLMFGLYTMGTIENDSYKHYWIEKWISPIDDEGCNIKFEGMILADTLGRIGIILNRSFYEGSDVEVKILSLDLHSIVGTVNTIHF